MTRSDRRLTTSGKRAVVRCPSVLLPLGYSKYNAAPGDLVSFDTGNGHCRLGKVVGRVDAAGGPANGQPVNGWICVLVLSQHGVFAHELWVDSAWVQSIYPVTEGMVRFFMTWLTVDPAKQLAMAEYGSLSAHGSCALPDDVATSD
jgi:hypothetical protein